MQTEGPATGNSFGTPFGQVKTVGWNCTFEFKSVDMPISYSLSLLAKDWYVRQNFEMDFESKYKKTKKILLQKI